MEVMHAKPCRLGAPLRINGMGRTHSRVFWGIGWELGTVVFV